MVRYRYRRVISNHGRPMEWIRFQTISINRDINTPNLLQVKQYGIQYEEL